MAAEAKARPGSTEVMMNRTVAVVARRLLTRIAGLWNEARHPRPTRGDKQHCQPSIALRVSNVSAGLRDDASNWWRWWLCRALATTEPKRRIRAPLSVGRAPAQRRRELRHLGLLRSH